MFLMSISQNHTLNILLIRGLKISQSVLTFFIMSNLFNEEEFGYYAYSYSIALSFIVLSYFGSEQLSIKILTKTKLFIGRLVCLKIFFSLIFTTLFSIFIYNIVPSLDHHFIFFMSLYMLFNCELLIFTFFNISAKLNVLLLNLLISFLITTSMKIYSLYSSDITVFYISIFCDSFISFVLFMIYIFKNKHASIFEVKVMKFARFFKVFYKAFFTLFIATILIQLNIRVDSYFVGSYLGGEELSNYSIALKFNELFAILISSIITIFSPAFFKCKSKKDLSRVINKIIIRTFIIYIVSSIFIYFMYDLINFYAFDDKYSEAKNVILILFLATFFGGVSSIVSLWYIYHGNESSKTKRVFIALIINITLSIYLIPQLGLVGAALVNLVVNFTLSILLNFNREDLREVFRNVVFKINI